MAKKAVDYFPVWMVIPIWALFVGVVLDWSVRLAYENHLFADHAQRVAGHVVNKQQEVQQGGRGGLTYTYLIAYRYEAENLHGSCVAQVQLATWNEVQIGGEIPITYLPERPSDNRIDLLPENTMDHLHATMGLSIGTLFLVTGAALIWRRIKINQLYARLRKEGARCKGIVTGLVDVRTGKAARKLISPFSSPPRRVTRSRAGPAISASGKGTRGAKKTQSPSSTTGAAQSICSRPFPSSDEPYGYKLMAGSVDRGDFFVYLKQQR